MASTQTAYGLVSLGDSLAEAENGRVSLREDLDVGAFGLNAVYQREAGETVVPFHHEAGPGGDRHEELYVVVQGSASFTIDGDTVEDTPGTVIFAGAVRGRLLGRVPGEGLGAALEATNRGLEVYPGNAHLLYNVACMQSLLGHDEAALTALAGSVSKWDRYKEQARKDDDFEPLREDPRFLELVA
jgi:hypothetical protein